MIKLVSVKVQLCTKWKCLNHLKRQEKTNFVNCLNGKFKHNLKLIKTAWLRIQIKTCSMFINGRKKVKRLFHCPFFTCVHMFEHFEMWQFCSFKHQWFVCLMSITCYNIKFFNILNNFITSLSIYFIQSVWLSSS